MILQYKFVDTIPDEVPEGYIFISIKYKTAIHKCVCGCGKEVITPISPTDWQLTFNGNSVSLSPSIGSWNLDCKSHYWITKNEIVHSRTWDEKEIKAVRKKAARKRNIFFSRKKDKDI